MKVESHNDGYDDSQKWSREPYNDSSMRRPWSQAFDRDPNTFAYAQDSAFTSNPVGLVFDPPLAAGEYTFKHSNAASARSYQPINGYLLIWC